MSSCRYCIDFVQSIRRLNAKEDEIVGRRLCATTKEWKNPNEDPCDAFRASTQFYCDRLQCWVSIDGCKHKREKKLNRKCKHCSQYSEVLDTIRFRSRTKAAVVPEKPILRRRT